jgi:hypothetical protein
MQTIQYDYINKSTWGDGPWQTEPDKVQFQDEATGLPCLLVRAPVTGGWCGYVGVAKGHPAFKKHYDKVKLPVGVHGGLTFSGFCAENDKEHGICHVPDPGEPDHVWWLGFDHAHAGDLTPAIMALLKSYGGGGMREWETYRDLAYAKDQCALLALQLV